MTRTGRTGGGRADGRTVVGGRADRGTWDKGEVEGRTARRLEANGQTRGWADESRRGADRAD